MAKAAGVSVIRLTPAECREFQRVCATTALQLLQIKAQIADQITAAERPSQQALQALARKYRGIRLDRRYRLDEGTCSLVEIER